MNWNEERYVRLYTRDTATWRRLPWQAKAAWPLILRKLDRQGRTELEEDIVPSLAALIELPEEVVEPALAALLLRKVIELHGLTLSAPNFIEAQEAVATPAARAQAYRDRKKAAEEPQVRHASSRASQNVTPSLAVPSLAVPSLNKDQDLSSPLAPTEPAAESSKSRPTDSPPASNRAKRGVKRPWPEGFMVSPAIEAMSRAEGLPDPHVVIRDFHDKALSNGYVYVDWEAAFRTWMRSDITRQKYPAWLPPPRVDQSRLAADDQAGPPTPEAIAGMQAALHAMQPSYQRNPSPGVAVRAETAGLKERLAARLAGEVGT